ncbi:protein phosphatase 2C domain-containing protein [Variovorax guangxiensis]|uniref:Protein phosphatase 2C domain-containing protein n=1 Tax=Variovorax guangxiensis TaxID=1775474 RepID=A0A3S1F5J4_9BURK|nr:PP2C family serine/threonine-protein phosphatase [Variovorax guangxiensis]RUR71071.1 protein phosphatase 2C domain-containing protein [Variovorax guangxiensis]
MNWRVVSAIAIGTSHRTNGSDCQDDCWAMVEQLGAERVLAVFVADGAGSARYGRDGATTAVQSAARFMTEAFASEAPRLTIEQAPTLARDCIQAVRSAIFELASAKDDAGAAGGIDPIDIAGKKELEPRDFACTFLGAISTSQATLVFQIGDGAIVLDTGNGLELFAAPMTGEYANMTHFVTQDDCLDVMVHKLYPNGALKLAAFSDGLQRLALNMAQGTPHEPFFEPFFSVLAKATAEQEDMLQGQLAAFLDSAPVNERTDDDKSLALAVRCE